jgi:hypothetical protein
VLGELEDCFLAETDVAWVGLVRVGREGEEGRTAGYEDYLPGQGGDVCCGVEGDASCEEGESEWHLVSGDCLFEEPGPN